MTQTELANRLGIPQSGVSLRESGRFKGWTRGERRKIAKAFDMSVDDFDILWRDRLAESSGSIIGIPVINRAPAGGVVDYEEYGIDTAHGYEYIDHGGLAGDHLFAVVVAGDSMEPTIIDGDYVVFNPLDREFPRRGGKESLPKLHGALCFIRFDPTTNDGGCTIARVYPNGDTIMLTKDNRTYPTATYKREQIVQIAIGVERRTKKGL